VMWETCDVQDKVPEVMSAHPQANGKPAAGRKPEDAGLVLPPLTFDYELSSSYHESPRYRSQAFIGMLDMSVG